MSDDLKQIISEVAGEQAGEKKNTAKIIKVLVFELDNEEYAVHLEDLREIIKIPDITPIPNSPEFISGILNLRGKIVVVVNLEKRFALVRENKTIPKHIIVTKVNDNNFGVIVDNVKEVLSVPVTAIQPAPGLVSGKIHADYLDGVIVFDDEEESEEGDKKKKTKKKSTSRLIVLLDLSKLLQDKELLQLGETVQKTVGNNI